MPDEGDQTEPAAEEAPGGPIFSAYGIASAVLGVLSVAAIALGALIWTTHRGDVDERHYQSRVMQTAADWTGVLINMNTDNVDANLQRLHDGTVGELNADFDSAMQPYRQVVQRLQARSTGRIEAVAIEAVHHEPDAQPGRRPSEPLPAGIARRTDTVMVVATSVSENVGGKPQIVHWNLRLAVSDVDGRLLISQLGSIR
ncbi:hypothetical protein [Mycobacterium kyorinense]|uniref:Mammalian cell entry protein n=1 Tax=Mycobacterium kyorinense TaxID=487514 RepID=A0A1X1XN32_9MYCO|nr:hypothetical protein [Mycobacterium kyorinense]ORW00265.1 hypothetical protein AWC14_10500 [Mycobacterium kyorinense]